MAAMGAIGFSIRMILAIFNYPSPQCFLSSFKTIRLLFQEKKQNIDFQDGGHGDNLGFPIGTILAIIITSSGQYYQVTLMLPTKIQVNWSFGSGEEAKNRFSRWPPWRDFSYF